MNRVSLIVLLILVFQVLVRVFPVLSPRVPVESLQHHSGVEKDYLEKEEEVESNILLTRRPHDSLIPACKILCKWDFIILFML